MSIEFLDCLKREGDISIKPMFSMSQNRHLGKLLLKTVLKFPYFRVLKSAL